MIKKLLPYILSAAILAGAVAASSYFREPEKTHAKATDSQAEPQREMRGLWVTYMSLDVENESEPEKAFEQKIDRIIENMKKTGLNTMFAQVRPFCDAIYPSRFYPWSHILTGAQGEDPGYDPLGMMCEKCRENDISVHAWINPYRISTGQSPSELSADNPYVKDKSIGVEINGGLYLDPASQKARELIVNGAIELIERYDIDGIQFDDYFYPEDCGDFDKAGYEEYKKRTASPLSLADYRKENVNKLIQAVYSAVHSTRNDAVFGIAPQGNLPNNEALYADVEKWCAEAGYIDYICPQIYFSLDNPALTFEDGLEQWLSIERHDGLRLYVGLPAYKAGTDADGGTWLDNSDILKTEIEIIREQGCDGFLLYSSDSYTKPESAEEIQNVMNYLTTSPTQ